MGEINRLHIFGLPPLGNSRPTTNLGNTFPGASRIVLSTNQQILSQYIALICISQLFNVEIVLYRGWQATLLFSEPV